MRRPINATPQAKRLSTISESKAPDGYNPQQTLTDVHGTFYGETLDNTGNRRYGTIFTVTPSGSETVLHEVTKKQGLNISQLTLAPRPTGGGLALYGTGQAVIGTYDYGTVVRVTQSGSVVVLHDFGGGADGAYPEGGLINVDGTFYGTTYEGGNGCTFDHGCGTVFSVTPSGTETVVYAFHGETQDGGFPRASLVDLNGTLYGTTNEGGSANLGTVFSVTASGTEHVLHSFQGSGDGEYPEAGLVAVNGTLYGTTASGGRYSGGTVFSITPSGTETILHSFVCVGDGCSPAATLLALNGKMYGTTTAGEGDGIVFSITPSGTEKVLHVFTGGSDGAYPYGGLINIRRTLYGTTKSGGTYNDGTVYSITL
jgi:uncharacterized repeat protein (TIGR03803 family)